MPKQRESITLDQDVNEKIHSEAKKQRIGFSTLVNKILYEYTQLNKL
jgi:hypothetical protein